MTKLVDAGVTSRLAWVQQAGGPQTDALSTITLTSAGIQVVGMVQPPNVNFGPLAISSASTVSTGFFATLAEPITLVAKARGVLPGLVMYPNPASNHVVIRLPAVPGAPTATLILTDAVGRVVRTTTLPLPATGLRHELPLLSLTSGLYTLRVQAGTQQATQILAVE
ncbi:T9SS type A sorting domain-containing protein [Hymenobacter cellulosilyticus]|uniref:T9SS type A sorting domain-containing protein n=1 Tax=Hymenobacter cellulosilyticus TaxID=2932248 RepID=A0A8T9QFB8_9BACT|nr:T9SS type A sorting domain-containing protein [Hymenobacter cellulosilyticus]UOQ75111.1 T9SS type A sorting domain-containing protein [Hymenobacter cellulosilyticus]